MRAHQLQVQTNKTACPLIPKLQPQGVSPFRIGLSWATRYLKTRKRNQIRHVDRRDRNACAMAVIVGGGGALGVATQQRAGRVALDCLVHLWGRRPGLRGRGSGRRGWPSRAGPGPPRSPSPTHVPTSAPLGSPTLGSGTNDGKDSFCLDFQTTATELAHPGGLERPGMSTAGIPWGSCLLGHGKNIGQNGPLRTSLGFSVPSSNDGVNHTSQPRKVQI